MSGEKKVKGSAKRPASKARKQLPVPSNNRRKDRQRVPRESHPASQSPYGTRAVSRSGAQGLSITVNIPPLRRPKSGDRPMAESRRRFLPRPLFALPVLIAAGGVALAVMHHDPKVSTIKTAAAATRTAPDYSPLVPSATQASATDYDGTRNLVSYTTTFSDVRITVSQQPLPASFLTDRDALKRAADSIRASQRTDTDKGTVYVATNDTAGDQMGIYAAPKLLLFIHTDKKLDTASWKAFIELLQAKDWKPTNS